MSGFELDLNRAFTYQKYVYQIDNLQNIDQAREIAKMFLHLYLAQQQVASQINLPLILLSEDHLND